MFERKHCDNCNRMLEHGDLVTVIIPNVEVSGRYRKNHQGFRLKLSEDAIDFRAAKVYCQKCLNIEGHFLEEK